MSDVKTVKKLLTTTDTRSLRQAARRRNYVITKRRSNPLTPELSSGWQITSSITGEILAGYRYELSAEDVRDWLNEH